MNCRFAVFLFAAITAAALSAESKGLPATLSTSAKISVTMQDLSKWAFEGGTWKISADGLMQPPDKFQDYYTAFYLPSNYGDLDASFEFRLEQGFADAGIILHAQDARNYYLVHFPTVGQQWRAKHFWIAISRVDTTGYKHLLKLALVPQVVSNIQTWHQARVVVKGTGIEAWVDGHLAATASERGISRPGRTGVAGFFKYSMRNLAIQGKTSTPRPWLADLHPVQNWFHPCPDTTYGKWQYPPSVVRTPKGDLLMAFQVSGMDAMGEAKNKANWLSCRSSDGGKHWTKPEPVKVKWPAEVPADAERYGSLFVTQDKRLMFQYQKNDLIYMAESTDDGYTWGEAWKANIVGEWPKDMNELYAYGPVLPLKDGSLLRMVYGRSTSDHKGLYTHFDWAGRHGRAFSLRSTDGGRSWSSPKDMDGSPVIPQFSKPRSTTLDLSESSCVQVGDGAVKCYIRPLIAPFMWLAESRDSGQSWAATTFGSFPGYAANAFRTSEGAILVSHRMPSLAINTSLDDGLNWDQGTIVGTDIWAMGDMVEVAPNTVLFIYMDSLQTLLRAQFIRVTPSGLEPVLEMLPRN